MRELNLNEIALISGGSYCRDCTIEEYQILGAASLSVLASIALGLTVGVFFGNPALGGLTGAITTSSFEFIMAIMILQED